MWVKKQWPKVEARLTTTTGADIVRATQTFCDTASRDDVEQFFTTHKSFSAERALQQSLERIDACVRNRNQQQDALTAWLNHKPQSGNPGNKQ
jgi:aminopeptidase N/puromycin-sensitive aminopeptidase